MKCIPYIREIAKGKVSSTEQPLISEKKRDLAKYFLADVIQAEGVGLKAEQISSASRTKIDNFLSKLSNKEKDVFLKGENAILTLLDDISKNLTYEDEQFLDELNDKFLVGYYDKNLGKSIKYSVEDIKNEINKYVDKIYTPMLEG